MTQSDVTQKLVSITHKDVRELLDAKHGADPTVGIAIVNLSDMQATNAQGLTYHFHAARVFTSSPEAPNYVTPHYHLKGEEPYHILSGDGGEMNLGKVVDGRVEWQPPQSVDVGDIVNVQEGEVHSLRNAGHDPLDFTFACPDEHLTDHSAEHPEGDRYLAKDLPDGIPAHYPVKG